MLELAVTLLGSKLGRQVLIYGSLALGVVFLLLRIYSAGKSAEKARQIEASLKAMRERARVDDELVKITPDERRERLRKWVSPDNGV